MNKILVKKLWWENVSELIQSSDNVLEDLWLQQAVVVSAFRCEWFSTTDFLIDLANNLWLWNYEKAFIILEYIKKSHKKIVSEKLDGELLEQILKQIDFIFDQIHTLINNWIKDWNKIQPQKINDYSINNWDRVVSLIWLWEDIWARLFAKVINIRYLLANCISTQDIAVPLDLSNIITKFDIEWKNKDDIFKFVYTKLLNLVLDIFSAGKIPVLPGYIWMFPEWIEKAIWRWYTDATAAALAVWLKLSMSSVDVVLEIQKSVKWVLSIDPRVYSWDKSKIKLIKNLDYMTAKEIVWVRGAQAKLLNTNALRNELLSAWVMVHLFNPFDKSNPGTYIWPEIDSQAQWVEFVWWKKNVCFVTVSSPKMWRGYFGKLAMIISKYKSIDIIWTSETEISFTISWGWDKEFTHKLLDDLRKHIQSQWSTMDVVSFEDWKALVYCIWQNMRNQPGLFSRAAWSLAKRWIDIELASQGRLQRAMVFGIKEEHLQLALNALHEEFCE